MENDEIISYYDDLMRLAVAKCNSQTDAEDLVGDTLLAAFCYLQKGGHIAYPKTWLTNTLLHKYHDALRRKYRCPVTVYLDEIPDVSEEADEAYFASEEAARVRKTLNFLGHSTREVLIRFYFGNQSVLQIAEALRLPEGTVKSRLSAGRSQMRKGLENMEANHQLPGKLYLSIGGCGGRKDEPMSLVEDDRIAQNLLMLAYEKPVDVAGLSRAIGIPAAYVEPIVRKLVDGELMRKTDGGRVYSDFIITTPQDALRSFRPQLDFAHRHFDAVWSILEKMSEQISAMPFAREPGAEERVRLDRYAVLKALQDLQFYITGKPEYPDFPKRRDGGRWLAQATAVPAGYDEKATAEASEYRIHGGHRSSEALVAGGAKTVRLYEFDTTLFDNPHRFAFSWELYFKYIIPLLWCIYDGVPPEEMGKNEIPNEMIANIPALEQAGLIGRAHQKLCVKIPVLKKAEYERVCAAIQSATQQIRAAIGKELSAFVTSWKTPIPKHLTSVPELYRYNDAFAYFAMAIVREAHGRGLHLKGVDGCCPPVVMAFACNE